eukprot:757181-Hanusia_phi.AAC.2
MVAEWGGPEKEYKEQGIVQRRFPVIDFTPPTLQEGRCTSTAKVERVGSRCQHAGDEWREGSGDASVGRRRVCDKTPLNGFPAGRGRAASLSHEGEEDVSHASSAASGGEETACSSHVSCVISENNPHDMSYRLYQRPVLREFAGKLGQLD